MQISANAQAIAYLISAVLFVLALKGLTHPASARRGNFLGMAGMAIAIIATLLGNEVQSYGFIIAGVVLGGLIGVVLAMRIQMTAMPQLVAALHSFVGLAAVLVAIGTFVNKRDAGLLNAVLMGELSAGVIIGAITFTGSVIAFGNSIGELTWHSDKTVSALYQFEGGAIGQASLTYESTPGVFRDELRIIGSKGAVNLDRWKTRESAEVPMLSRTHGQTPSGTPGTGRSNRDTSS